MSNEHMEVHVFKHIRIKVIKITHIKALKKKTSY